MNPELTKQYEEIKKEIEVLNGKLADMASLSLEELEEYKKDTMKQVHKTGKEISQTATAQAKKIDEYTRENPWVVAAALSVVGLVVGLILSNNKSKE